MNSPRTRFYRDKVDGKIMGVCAGIADYTGVDALWIRLGVVALTISQGWPILIYIAAAWFADKKPIHLYADQDDKKFWQGVRQSPARTTRDIRSKFREIDNRLADVELYYVSNNKQLADEIESLR